MRDKIRDAVDDILRVLWVVVLLGWVFHGVAL